MEQVGISVVIPTRNERNNIRPLLTRLSHALAGRRAEVLVIDDSTDDTPEVASELAKTLPLRVLVMHRGPGERIGGLGGAVVTALRLAAGEIAVVMDGDLQHPPETVLDLVAPIERGDVDMVVASRHRADEGLRGLSSRARVGCSRLATAATKTLFWRRLRDVTDPMSGFFAVRLSALDVDSLRPIGFKILLETIARSRLSIAEVGFTFGRRVSGDSKAGVVEGARFARHLVRLRIETILTARQRRAAGFAAVGASGLVVNTVAFWGFLHYLHAPYLLAAVLATQVSTTWNFIGMELFVFAAHKKGHLWPRFLKFCLLNNSVMLARLPVLALMVSVLHCPKTFANFATLLLVFVVRFGISDRYIYDTEPALVVTEITSTSRVGPVEVAIESEAITRPEAAAALHEALEATPEPAVGYRYCYDIHGIVTLGSDVALPELAYFLRTTPADAEVTPDIGIRVGSIGQIRKRTRLVRAADGRGMRWEEHFGPLSANFAIEFGPPISVTASRSLARSPHVLYTNVVEALLRFVFVERGYMLLHAACMDVDGRGVMLSARTDTGKTGTVLKLLRTSEGQFLSDDMTIIDRSGAAYSFPKPLTISHHTLHSVDAGDLRRWEWAWLRVQSRLHSKEGRGFAMKLADLNLPIMTINGWTQRLVPPPKYHVQRLVPCSLTKQTVIDRLYIIERGEPHHSVVPGPMAIEEMLENTEDAYGFPPYRYLSESLVVNGVGFAELKQRERSILESAMQAVTVHRLGSDDFSWADRIAAALNPGIDPSDLVDLGASAVVELDSAVVELATDGNGSGNGHVPVDGAGRGNGNGVLSKGAIGDGTSGNSTSRSDGSNGSQVLSDAESSDKRPLPGPFSTSAPSE